jgi:hypothetical protein
MGDAEARPSFNPIGIVLIVLGIGFDAATSNYEERAFFRIAKPASQAEVVAFSSLFGSFTSLAMVRSLSPDEIPTELTLYNLLWLYLLWPVALLLARRDPQRARARRQAPRAAALPHRLERVRLRERELRAAHDQDVRRHRHRDGQVAAQGAHRTPTPTPTRTLTRTPTRARIRTRTPTTNPNKVLTLVISFVLFAHPVTWKYGVGGLFVVISLIATQELQRRKGGDVQHVPPKDEAAEMEPLSEDVELAPMPPSNHEDEGEQSPQHQNKA